MRTALALVIVAAVTVRPAPAHADAAAEALFGEGRDLMTAGNIPEACNRFQRSQLLEPKVGTLLNLGDCRERQGQIANAWAAFMEASSLAIRDNDEVRASEARRRAALLEPQLASMTVNVVATPGLLVTRDGAPVAAATWDTSVPVDPGKHVIEATAPGYKPWSTRIEVSVGGHGIANVPALAIDPDAVVPELPGQPFVVRPPLRHLGFGIAFGGTSDTDIVGGLRVIGGYPVPHGAIRATLQGLYTRWHPDDNPPDPYHLVELYAFGLGLDYLLAWGSGLASAIGIGAGIDFLDDNYDRVTTDNWAAFRVSPLIVRLRSPQLELGLHFQLVTPANVVVFVLGVDWFVW